MSDDTYVYSRDDLIEAIEWWRDNYTGPNFEGLFWDGAREQWGILLEYLKEKA